MRGLHLLAWIGVACFATVQAVLPASAEDRPVGTSSPIAPGVSEGELDAERGGDIIPISEATLEATLDNNTITSSVTGNNSVGGSAFTGASGLFTVIQNSGNQVIIQDSTIVNLTVE